MTTRMHADDVVGSQPFDELVAGGDGLTFGYVGNCGLNFDNRSFRIWTQLRHKQGYPNLKTLWAGDKLTRRALSEASRMVDAYKMGLQFALEGATPFYGN